MKTINAKELRQKLDQTFDRVLSGENVIVKHRFKKPILLSSVEPSNSNKKALRGLAAFDTAKKKPSPYSQEKSIKNLYRQSIANKHAQ